MELIRAAFRYDADLAACAAPEFRSRNAGLNGELLHCIGDAEITQRRIDLGVDVADPAQMSVAGDVRRKPQAVPTPVETRVLLRVLGFVLGVVAALGLSNAGCILNQYPSDPHQRMDVLMNESENLRQIEYEWQRIWFTDQPSHLTPVRIHGGVGQATVRLPVDAAIHAEAHGGIGSISVRGLHDRGGYWTSDSWEKADKALALRNAAGV